MAEAKRDGNYVPTLIGVSSTDGVTPVTVYVDPVTHRLYVDATGGTGTVTSIATGTGLTGGTITTTGTISLDTPLQPIATLTGNAGKFLRVNAGETAVEYATVSGSGTVTSVSVVSANGFNGSVANATTTPAITITTTLTDGSIPFASSNAFSQNNSNLYWDNANTRLIVGNNTSDYTAISSTVNVVKTGPATFVGAGYGASSGGLYLGLRANGTPGSATAITNGNILNSFAGAGYDGTAWITASRGGMRVVSSENWSATAHGTGLVFSVTPVTTTTASDVFYINNDGNIGIGTSTPIARVGIASTRSASFPSSGGTNFTIFDNTFTDTSSTGTVASIRANVLGTPTFAASSSTTYTAATTLYVAAPPTAGTNVTITTGYTIWSDSGTNRFDGSSIFGTTITPQANDGAALGTTSLMWSDLFLASGGVINFNNGNITLTHSAGNLALAGGTFTVPASGLIINATTVTSTGTQLNYLNAATGTTGTTSTNLVFSTSPTLVTPVLGVATATSINKVTLTTPATGSTLTIADGKTLTVSNSITLAGTDSTVMTFPTTSATIARTDAGQTFTGVNTFTSPKIITDVSDTNGNEVFKITATGSAVNEITIANAATGNAPSITASGGDSNIDLNIGAKGTGEIKHTTATYQDVVTATDGATVTFDMSDGNYQKVTLGGNRTLALSNVKTGQVFMLNLIQDGTGSRTVTWFSGISWSGGSAPTLTTTASKQDVFGFICTGAGAYLGFIVGQNC